MVGLVLAGARAVQITRLLIVLHAEGELGDFAFALIRFAWVAEIEVAKDFVSVGTGLGICNVVASLRSNGAGDVDASHVLAEFEIVSRSVGPWADAILTVGGNWVGRFGFLDNERRNWVARIRVIVAGAWYARLV